MLSIYKWYKSIYFLLYYEILYSKKVVHQAVYYNNLGLIDQESGDIQSARANFNKGLNLLRDSNNIEHPYYNLILSNIKY